MKKILAFVLAVLTVVSFSACKAEEIPPKEEQEVPPVSENSGEENLKPEEEPIDDGKRKEVSSEGFENAAVIVLSDDKITVDGKTPEESGCVTVGGEIIYYHNIEKYPSGNKYGEGEETDSHTEEEAAEHTLVTITKPGEYFIRGELKGQLAVDLGKDAKNDPNAKVTLIFGGADITCEIAPAVIFYNVYECGNADEPSEKVDTEKAGANVIIADGSLSNVSGANVAKIFEDGKEEKKLHKYDAALYSKMSMNVSGGENGTGILNINGENEGVGTEMHLSVNGGIININANDDGINANEDGVSVISVNGGKLTVFGGLEIEGDGIDSNGWLVINGGELYSSGNGRSADGGIDADNGIYINGGKVLAFGSKNDSINSDSEQLFAVLEFSAEVSEESTFEFVDSEGNGIKTENERLFRSVVVSDESFAEGKEYSLLINGIHQEYSSDREFWENGKNESSGVEDRKEKLEKDHADPEDIKEWLKNEKDIPENIRKGIEFMLDVYEQYGSIGISNRYPAEKEAYENPAEPSGQNPGGFFELEPSEKDKTVFVIAKGKNSFFGITDSAKYIGKETVSFTINGIKRMEDIYLGDLPEIVSIECSEDVPPEDVKIILIYTGRNPEINISRSCFLSEGYDKINGLFEGLEKGDYRISIEVVEENEKYMGIEYFSFDVVD